MPTIKIVGPAVVFDLRNPTEADGETPTVDDASILRSLHGLEDTAVFSEHLADEADQALFNAGVSGGVLRFEFDEATDTLYGTTEYSAPRTLTTVELALLKEYTIGQWADGIGSNFYQSRMEHGLAPQLLIWDAGAVSIEQRG